MAKKFHAIKINPKKFTKDQIPFLLLVLPVASFMMLPLLYIFNHAFKPFDELIEYPPKFFVRRPTLDNFFDLFDVASSTGIPVTRYYFRLCFIKNEISFKYLFN